MLLICRVKLSMLAVCIYLSERSDTEFPVGWAQWISYFFKMFHIQVYNDRSYVRPYRRALVLFEKKSPLYIK